MEPTHLAKDCTPQEKKDGLLVVCLGCFLEEDAFEVSSERWLELDG